MTLYMTESVLQLNIINSAQSTGHLKGEKMYLDPYILNKLINMIHRPKRKKKKKSYLKKMGENLQDLRVNNDF